jgi:hypothetical protein
MIVSGPIFSGRTTVERPLFSGRPAALALVCKIDSGTTFIACRNLNETDAYSPSLMTAKFPGDEAGVNFCT